MRNFYFSQKIHGVNVPMFSSMLDFELCAEKQIKNSNFVNNINEMFKCHRKDMNERTLLLRNCKSLWI